MARRLYKRHVTISDPATLAVIGTLAAYAAAVDLWLLYRGRLPISTVVRGNRALKACWLGLTAHLVFKLRYDPLTNVGRVIARFSDREVPSGTGVVIAS